MNSNFGTLPYKRSRTAYILQSMFEYFITLMVTDAFLAKILTNLGIGDSLIGIIATFISLAMVFQLGSLTLSGVKFSTKKLVIICSTLSQVLFALVFVIPFMPLGALAKKVCAVLFILIAYALQYLVWPILYKWAYGFVSPDRRARFSATKEMLSLGAGIIFTAVTGYIIDKFEGMGNISGAFLFVAVSMAITSICNLICLILIKDEKKQEKVKGKAGYSAALKATVGNKGFWSCVIAISMWEFARFFQLGFMGTFKTVDLAISVLFIQVINMAGYGIRLILSKPVAKYSDKKGYAKGLELGLIIASLAFFTNTFTSKSTWYLIIVYTILHLTCYVGINSNGYNILYSYVDNEYMTQALAIKNSIAGIIGFSASLIAGKLLSHIQANGNVFLGIPLYGQQVLSFISFIITIAALIYVRLVVSKQKKVN